MKDVRHNLAHPRWSRRCAVQAGALAMAGMSLDGLARWSEAGEAFRGSAQSVIYIFLSGGLGQHDSFDMKPHAPAEIRGEFNPIATVTPGVQICEHLPMLAARSSMWSLVRSLTHPHNEHSDGHHVMLTGRTNLPPGFNRSKPQPVDYPSIASIVNDQFRTGGGLPSAAVLPEKLIHRTGRVIPGQFGGQMGPTRDPWFIEACPFNGTTYGAFPEYEFHHARGRENVAGLTFRAPNLSLPHELLNDRIPRRLELLERLDAQRTALDRTATSSAFDRYREAAVSLLTDPSVKSAFDVTAADPKTLDRYGRNSFGYSLLMARRLIDVGVRLVQVNLGNNEAWDTHGNAFPNLKDFLFPPTDRAVSALLDDLESSGQLESTLIVMAGEFGRTPKLSHLANHYAAPGRDHWGGCQTVFLAGGGIQGGRVVGSSDKLGAYPDVAPQRPENFAATIYDALGIPRGAAWHDEAGRPHFVYQADPMPGLT